MPLYYDKFSDLAVDWPMIFVGWHGFGGGKLSAEQVIAYALEQIGQGTPEQDNIAALLANTAPQDWQTINRYLEQIVGDCFERETALRKWRLSALKQLLRTLPRLDKHYDHPQDEWLAVLEGLADFWARYDELPDSLIMWPTMSAETVQEMLAEQQAWVKREEIALRERTGAAK